MPRKCDVIKCNYQEGKIQLFKLPYITQILIPSDRILVKKKIRKATKAIHVCGKHFIKGTYFMKLCNNHIFRKMQ